ASRAAGPPKRTSALYPSGLPSAGLTPCDLSPSSRWSRFRVGTADEFSRPRGQGGSTYAAACLPNWPVVIAAVVMLALASSSARPGGHLLAPRPAGAGAPGRAAAPRRRGRWGPPSPRLEREGSSAARFGSVRPHPKRKLFWQAGDFATPDRVVCG